MKSQVLWKKYGKWIWAAWSVLTFGLALLTLHDMQTAEGTGLYLAFQAGAQGRGPYDLLVDCAGLLCLAGLILLPCLLFKQKDPEAFFAFLAAYLAFAPTASTAALVHLLDGTESIVVRQSLLEGKLREALWEGTAGLVPLLQVVAPVLVLAAALGRESGREGPDKAEKGEIKTGNGRSRAAGYILMAAVFLLLVSAAVVFPALTDICVHAVFYLLLLYGFRLWIKLETVYLKLHTWSRILFVFFWFRGLDKMIEVMSVYHL